MDGFLRDEWTIEAALVWIRTGDENLVRAANSGDIPQKREALRQAGLLDEDESSVRTSLERTCDAQDLIEKIENALQSASDMVTARCKASGEWKNLKSADLIDLRLNQEGGARWRGDSYDVVYLPRASVLALRPGRASEAATTPITIALPAASRRFAAKKNSSATLTWYGQRVRDWPKDQNPPSRADDEREGGDAGHLRENIRAARKQIAPPSWTKVGPRQR